MSPGCRRKNGGWHGCRNGHLQQASLLARGRPGTPLRQGGREDAELMESAAEVVGALGTVCNAIQGVLWRVGVRFASRLPTLRLIVLLSAGMAGLERRYITLETQAPVALQESEALEHNVVSVYDCPRHGEGKIGHPGAQ
eukprot:CAMPEP_0180660250 /NCGR_PEP_ID=MMETSP1037_2-20121125/58119_1 /TAXON_ID=632150 /ORGANISM="Azadinium spinosum, Strain 3D9" /LENGTH=139 /DNA_ID=CAMNT_0022687555 /DNA_START=71 /DNA_END=490 /DNA_ORIENTATION=+